MKFLVTGASGFVGKALTAEILFRGHKVVAVYGPNSVLPAEQDDRIRFVKADISEPDSLPSFARIGSVDVVIHAAGIAHRFGKTDASEYEKVNVRGVRNVAEAAVNLSARRFVLISSVLVYGREGRIAGRPVTESDNCRPADDYARSKLRGEGAAIEVCRSSGMPLSILRPAPIIGEGSKGNFSRLIAALDHGRFVWVGDGSNLKSVVYVGDVARIAAHLAERSVDVCEIYNVAAEPIAMRDIVSGIERELDVKAPWIAIPGSPLQQFFRIAKLTPLRSTATRLSGTLDTWLAEDVYSSERLSTRYSLAPFLGISEAMSREIKYYLTNR
jgi:UDP-glucose 4-epimerase